MPIKNLTDFVLPAFPRLGKLRKGGPSVTKTNAAGKSYNSYGPELDHWRLASERADVTAAFTAAYGPQPKVVNVFLPHAALDDNWSTWREEWSAGGLIHRCDGETMSIWRTPRGTYEQGAKPCPHQGQEKPACKPVGRLTVIVPELWQAGLVGYITFETHSLNDLLAIQATLLAVQEARAGHPRGMQGVPMVLRRVQEIISTPGTDGQRVRRTKWLAKLEPAADWVALQLEAARRMAYGDERLLTDGRTIEGIARLTDGRTVDTATGEIIDDDEPEDGDFEGEPTPEPPAPPAPSGNGNKVVSPECQAMTKAALEFFGQAGAKPEMIKLMQPYGVTEAKHLTPAQCIEITEKIGHLRAQAEAA